MARAMMTLLVCSLLLVSSGLAHAECVTADEATPESTCVVMAREGVRGVWFSLAEAEAIRRMRLELPELRLQVQRLEQLTAVQGERVTLYRESTRL